MILKSIELTNFRLFENKKFEFKPLTILTGPNSSGKSTVVKSLMLLQENLKAPNNLGRLTFKSGKHKLGNFMSVLKEGATENDISFLITYKLNKKISERLGVSNFFEDEDYMSLFYKYSQDKFQSENGRLTEYQIKLGKENNKLINVFSANQIEDKIFIKIDLSWFLKRILERKLKFRPNIYTIYEKDGKILPQDFENEFRRRSKTIIEEQQEFIENIENLINEDEKYKTLFNQVNDNIDQYSKEIESIVIGHDNNIKNLRESYNGELNKIYDHFDERMKETRIKFDKKIRKIEAKLIQLDGKENIELDKKHLKLEKNKKEEIQKIENEKSEEIQFIEDEKSNKIQSIENEKLNEIQSIEDKINIEKNRLETFKDNFILEREKEFEDSIKHLNQGLIRTEVYNLVEKAYENILKGLMEKEKVEYSIHAGQKNISSILLESNAKKTNWGGGLDSTLEELHQQTLVDVLDWEESTLFIKNILEQDTQFVTLGDVYGNQLADHLNEILSRLLVFAKNEIPIIPVSATRGFQQRLYKSSQTQFHLEEALSKLLSIQYRRENEKNKFIQKWMSEFGILDDDELFIAEVVDGDYVRGSINKKDANDEKMGKNIADKGLGISQLIPIIIFTADAMGTNKMVCIEEPGTHLHPDLQSKLVDFVFDAIDYKVQFLFETHSEYFIRKLQYQVVHDQKFDISRILIRYLNPDTDEDLTISLNEEGELIDQENEIIDSFGEGFLDLPTIWNNIRQAKKEIEKGYTIIACEGKNEVAFKALNFSNCIFYGFNGLQPQNSKGVYITVKKEPNIIGIRDRDFLTDSEIQWLEESHPNYKILRYYSYESYLFHPKNIAELLDQQAISDFDIEVYVDEIKKQIKKKYDKINRGIRQSRSTYEELKDNSELKSDRKNKSRDKREEEICQALKSEEFEECYKFFDVKREFDKSILASFQFKEEEYYRTKWFKKQIASILNVPLKN